MAPLTWPRKVAAFMGVSATPKMESSAKSIFCLILTSVSVLAWGNSLHAADEAKDGSVIMKNSLSPELTSMFPIGRTLEGVTLPSFSGDVLQSVIKAVTVTKRDEQYLDLTEMVITIYDAKRQPDMKIFMDLALYDMVSGVLISKTPGKMERASPPTSGKPAGKKTTLTADKIQFETETQISRMTGNVHLIIPLGDKKTLGLGKKSSTTKEKKKATRK